MRRNLLLALVLCLVFTSTGFTSTSLAGGWAVGVLVGNDMKFMTVYKCPTSVKQADVLHEALKTQLNSVPPGSPIEIDGDCGTVYVRDVVNVKGVATKNYGYSNGNGYSNGCRYGGFPLFGRGFGLGVHAGLRFGR